MKLNHRISVLIIAAASLVIASLPMNAWAEPLALFVKIDLIPGESTDAKHKDWIDAFGYGEGILLPTSGGMTTGRAEFLPIKVTKFLDKASPKVRLAAASGTLIKEVLLEFTSATSTGQQLIFRVVLQNVLISEVSVTATPSERPMEVLAFTYAKISWEYTRYGPDGSVGETVSGSWDLAANK